MAGHELGVLEAIGAGLLQGVAIVFPISGLGHGVVVAALGHGAGADIAPADARYLYACLHLGVGLALFAYFWRDWLGVARGLVGTAARTRSHPDQRRWAWRVVLAALPGCLAVGVLAGYARPLLHHPRLAAWCLLGNGVFMVLLWWWWRRSPRAGGLSGTHRARTTRAEDAASFAAELSGQPALRIVVLGLLPVAVLVPGVSGVGVTIAAGLAWALTQEQAARVALLLLTPVLLTWGAVELPDLGNAAYDGVRTATFVAACCALVAGYLAAALSLRYFRRASLRPFGYYCVVAGAAAVWALAAN